jgi:hypothetical protein
MERGDTAVNDVVELFCVGFNQGDTTLTESDTFAESSLIRSI